MKKLPVTFMVLISFVLWMCNGTEENTNNDSDSTEKVIANNTKSESSDNFYGSFTLTEMIPIAGDKELTAQDTKYLEESKNRTLGKTTLTLNEDGTFKRVFPHPSGNGSMQTWNGKYTLNEELLKMDVKMEDKTKSIEFKVLEKSNNKLSLSSSFGQIEMNYIYTK